MGETRDDLLGVPVLQSLILAARRRVVQGALYGTVLSVYYWSRYLPGRAGLPLLRYPNRAGGKYTEAGSWSWVNPRSWG